MSMQMRVNASDPRLYSPDRDVAHNFHVVIQHVAKRLEDSHWAELGDYLKINHITSDQMGEGIKAYILFVMTAVQDKHETPQDALTRVGWFRVPAPVQIAVMAYLGTVMTGMYFVGVREATLGAQGPCSDVSALATAADNIGRLLSQPKWKRILHSVRKATLEKIRSVTSKSSA